MIESKMEQLLNEVSLEDFKKTKYLCEEIINLYLDTCIRTEIWDFFNADKYGQELTNDINYNNLAHRAIIRFGLFINDPLMISCFPKTMKVNYKNNMCALKPQ